MTDAVLLLSGGIDSTVVLAELRAADRNPLCLVFDYGQTLVNEVEVARLNAARYQAECSIIKFPMNGLLRNCALTAGAYQGAARLPVNRTPEQISAAGTPPSYVPFRNGIFLAIAAAVAEDRGIGKIYCGGNGLSSGNYPDDTAAFAAKMQEAINEGTGPAWNCQVVFPNAMMSKAGVVKKARRLGVDLAATWSCYFNLEKHCGICDSCVQRQSAGAPL